VRSASRGGRLELRAVDADTQQPIPVRMHLRNARGKPVIPSGVVSWHDHFVFDGSIVLELPPGTYRFEWEHGPEYVVRSGYFTLDRNSQDTRTLELKRIADMSASGWYSGDLHVHRPLEHIELLARAEDLHVVPVITWWNKQVLRQQPARSQGEVVAFDANRRFYYVMAGEDERGGGALLYFHLKEPLPLATASREYPPSVRFLRQAKLHAERVHVDVEKPFWWDLPIWLATGLVDSIGIAHNHMQRDGVLANEAWGRPRDRQLYPDPHGNGRWTQDIYYHVLNSGFRIAPSAGSASGVLPNPPGYNRVYVHVEGPLDYWRWWENLRAGRVVVTNGPLLQPRVNGELPGHVFRAAAGQKLTLQPELTLTTREKIEYLEIILNGRTIHEIRLDEFAQRAGRLPELEITESGWIMIRAVTNHPSTYRFAASGPFYIEIGEQPRISRSSVQFFLDWLEQRQRQLEQYSFTDEAERLEVMAALQDARAFWQNLLARANAP